MLCRASAATLPSLQVGGDPHASKPSAGMASGSALLQRRVAGAARHAAAVRLHRPHLSCSARRRAVATGAYVERAGVRHGRGRARKRGAIFLPDTGDDRHSPFHHPRRRHTKLHHRSGRSRFLAFLRVDDGDFSLVLSRLCFQRGADDVRKDRRNRRSPHSFRFRSRCSPCSGCRCG